MIVPDGEGAEKAVLVDFGIAKIFAQPGHSSMHLTQTGEVFGSPLYMSPEQCMGQKLDARSDIYSLGCLLYECLTGAPPFTGDNFLNIIYRHINDSPDRFAKRKADRQLESIVLKALSKNPQDRFASMIDLRQHLEHCLKSLADGSDDEQEFDVGDYEERSGDEFSYYEDLAERGDANAQFEVALFYRDGLYVEQDDEMAFEWCLKSAEQGLAEAEAMLGDMYYDGIGVEQDYKESLRWYMRAAEQANPSAQVRAADMLEKGMGAPVDSIKARQLVKLAAEAGNIWAQLRFGDIHAFGEGVPVDQFEAAHWYRQAAEQGDAEGQISLALCYRDGKGVEQDYKEQVGWLTLAADQGHCEAQRMLAECYCDGLGVAQDDDEALRWMSEAALNGDARALVSLGYWSAVGLYGLPKDQKQAIRYYREAAELDDPEAKYYLGSHYRTGDGVVCNLKTAFHWFKASAKGGSPRGQHELALCYRDGLGTNKDEASFIKWLKEAAENGLDAAQYDIGLHYSKKGDRAQAEYWLAQAAEQGHSKAKRKLDELRGNTSSAMVGSDNKPRLSQRLRPANPGSADSPDQEALPIEKGKTVLRRPKRMRAAETILQNETQSSSGTKKINMNRQQEDQKEDSFRHEHDLDDTINET